MVFCVPDSFLGRGCGTAGLDGWLGYNGQLWVTHQGAVCPGVGLRETFTVASKEDGWVGESVWRAHPAWMLT